MTAQCALHMGALKIFGTPWLRPRPLYYSIYFHRLLFRSTLWMFLQNLKSVTLPVPKRRGGSQVASPQSRGWGGHRGSGMVPFERALVSSYGPSIVTLPLYTFQRYWRFCSLECHFFPTPPLVSPKFPHVPLGVGGLPFGYKERRHWANCSCN